MYIFKIFACYSSFIFIILTKFKANLQSKIQNMIETGLLTSTYQHIP